MKVYAVVRIETTPYGEPMYDGATQGMFRTRKSANAYMREIKECEEFNGGKIHQYAIRSYKVED